jgi:signal transduction histidine kinase/CheY-like chemotaxis protein
LKNVFLFFRQKGDADSTLERDFRVAYQEPSLLYLQLAFVLGIIGFAGFLLMDLIHDTVPAVPGVPSARISICVLYLFGIALTALKRQFVARHYTPIVNFYMSIGMLGAALLPMAVHGNSSTEDIFWSLNSSLTTGAIVIYGTSRLTARNTALIVLVGCFIGICTTLRLPTFDWYPFGRLIFHLTFVNLAAFSLRETVERHERSLFLLARENLSRNIYAKELEAARARAEEGNEIKLRFLANMSHEFRTPMNGVMQTLEIASRTASSELAELIVRARRSGHALLGTLNNILEYTRWSQPTLLPSASPVSLSAAIRQFVQRHEKAAADRGLAIALRLDLMSSEDTVRTDPLMIDEVVTRLLDNAIRFTPSGRVNVEVQLSRRGPSHSAALLQISVADTGVGIAEGKLDAIYKPFLQLRDASDRDVGGTGLGLAIVARLIEVMKGTIDVTSEVGKGSTFRVSVPVEICKTYSLPNVDSVSTGRGNRRGAANQPLEGTVLLAEDNEFNAMLATELLTRMGLDVTLATDGAEAIRQAAGRRFDVILMDCQMPNIDGYEATRRIRMIESRGSAVLVPIIAVTANALAGDREKCLAAGMNDYLAKPYTAAQLRSKLVSWLPEPIDREDAGKLLESLRAPARADET